MIKVRSDVATTIGIVLTLSASAAAQRLPPDVVVSNPQVYEVTITTKFVVPKNGKKLTGLGVWHALPNARPWDGLDRTMGASAITYEPASGRIQHLSTNESQNVFWELREGLESGKKLEFMSRFRVRSVDRTYDLKRSIARWSDYHHNHRRNHATGRCQSRLDRRRDQEASIPRPKRLSSFASGSPNTSNTTPPSRMTLVIWQSILKHQERPLRPPDDDV